jgi:transposase-like protein
MNFTKEQTQELISKFSNEKNGLTSVLEMVLNSLMLSERKEFLKEDIDNKANGYRFGTAFGQGQQLQLKIPRDRQSAFSPLILALIREQDAYIHEVCFSLYTKGLTTKDVSEVMQVIYGDNYSKSKISNISQSFYEQMDAWRNRSLNKHYLAFYIDGLFVKLKRDKKYENECFYIILGVCEDGTREIVSIVNFPTESASCWETIFDEIKDRGVKSVGIIVSDSLSGVDKAIAKKFNTVHQKCIVHMQRNLMKKVRPNDKKEIASDFSQVLDVDNVDYTIENALGKFEKFTEKWIERYSGFKSYFSNLDIIPYFQFLDFDPKIRRMLYTTNWIERFNKSARRTLKIRGAFPNEESVLALITSVGKDMTEGTYSYPIYQFKNEIKLQRKPK